MAGGQCLAVWKLVAAVVAVLLCLVPLISFSAAAADVFGERLKKRFERWDWQRQQRKHEAKHIAKKGE